MANCRNGAAGTMKQKDGVGCEYLDIIVYDIYGLNTTNESQKLKFLEDNKFNVTFNQYCTKLSEIIAMRNNVIANRENYNFDIDGLVIKCATTDEKDLKRDRPEKQIAFKFELDIATTTLIDIDWRQSGKTFTPVAKVNAVNLCGTTVQNASLANLDRVIELQKTGLQIGCQVEVTKRGEIIPYVERVISKGKKDLIIPNTCTTCGAKLVKNGPFLECTNKDCHEVKVHQLMKWINKMDIMHLSRKTLDKLMAANKVNKIADFYNLTLNSVQGIEGIGQGFQRIIDEINRTRNPELAKFMAGFDIDGIGERVWKPIIDTLKLKSVSDIINLKATDLDNIPGIGPSRIAIIIKNVSEISKELIATEKVVGIKIPVKETKMTAGKLNGISFCFTGALESMKRPQAEAMVINAGGAIKSVSKGLTYLVTNDPFSGSAKNTKAQALGIKLIDEKTFLKMFYG